MEYRKKCNVCGNVFCYTDEDVNFSKGNAAMGTLSAVAGIASALGGGTIFHTAALNRTTERFNDNVVDYNKCPRCNSTNLSFVPEEEVMQLQRLDEKTVHRIKINSNATTANLLKRSEMFLVDEEWDNADGYAEAVLDVEPENAMAYVYKLMASLRVSRIEDLKQQKDPFEDHKHFKKAIRFGDEALVAMLNEAVSFIKVRNAEEEKLKLYQSALHAMNEAETEHEYLRAAALFSAICDYRDAAGMQRECREKAKDASKNAIYEEGNKLLRQSSVSSVFEAKKKFESISNWKNSAERIKACDQRIAELQAEKAWQTKGAIIAIALVVALLGACVIATPYIQYSDAKTFMENGDYESAYDVLTVLDDFRDSEALAKDCRYQFGLAAMKNGNYGGAISYFEALCEEGYGDATEALSQARYYKALQLYKEEEYYTAYGYFNSSGYKDSANYMTYIYALNESVDRAIEILETLPSDFLTVEEDLKMLYEARTMLGEWKVTKYSKITESTWLKNGFDAIWKTKIDKPAVMTGKFIGNGTVQLHVDVFYTHQRKETFETKYGDPKDGTANRNFKITKAGFSGTIDDYGYYHDATLKTDGNKMTIEMELWDGVTIEKRK